MQTIFLQDNSQSIGDCFTTDFWNGEDTAMTHQPMGVSGIDLDITTGRPRVVKTRAEHQAQEELKETRAMQEAVALSQELPAVLVVMARLYEQRLQELAKGDPFLQGLDQQAAAYNMKINLSSVVSTKLRKQAFGIVLTSMTDETQVAREDTDQAQ
jgi:hypothetical protein